MNSQIQQQKHEQQKQKQIIWTSSLHHFAKKDIVKKLKTKPTEWEKTFANHICDLPKIFKLLQLNNKKTNKPMKNWTPEMDKGFEKTFLQIYTNGQ